MRSIAFFISLVLLALSLGIAACGTIINGTREEVTIIAEPIDATVSVDGVSQNPGYFRGNLKRGSSHLIEISKAGYVTQLLHTGNIVTGWYAANLLIFPILGNVIEIITGGGFDIDPNPYFVRLTPGSGLPATETHSLDGYPEAIIPTAVLTALFVWLIIEASGSTQSFP